MQPPVFVKRTSSEVVIYINNTTQNKMFASDMTRQWGSCYTYIFGRRSYFSDSGGGGDVLLEFRNSVGMGPEKIWKWDYYLEKIWKWDIYSEKIWKWENEHPQYPPPSRCCILLTSVCDHVFLKMFARGGESKICRCVGLGAEEEGVSNAPYQPHHRRGAAGFFVRKLPSRVFFRF